MVVSRLGLCVKEGDGFNGNSRRFGASIGMGDRFEKSGVGDREILESECDGGKWEGWKTYLGNRWSQTSRRQRRIVLFQSREEVFIKNYMP